MFQKHKFLFAAIVPTIIWGFVVIPFRLLKNINPLQILSFRVLISVFTMLLIALIFNRKAILADYNFLKNNTPKQRNKQLLYVALSALFITANWYSFIYAVNAVGARVAGFSYMICPLFTALLGVFWLKERVANLQWLALLIAACSILLLAQGAFNEFQYSSFVAITYAVYLILQKKILAFNRFNLLMYQLLISILIMLPFSWQHLAHPIANTQFWQLVSLVAILFTVIPMLLMMYAFVGLKASTLGIIIYINPLVAFLVAFLYLNESVNFIQALAYSLILIAVLVFNFKEFILLPIRNKNLSQ